MDKKEMINLYNTLMMISTRGNDTLIMADCLKFLNQQIAKADAPTENVEPVKVVS